ncbi:hypothetical protein FSARC_1183 [Fusarium sarcochroum]|uniref:Acyclic terpene utilisation N-terminal domain-containing protein n=1 Tax=Fusarium sarcochroum TaxID=1208366 RepID=A0A8H4U984_9HYPO|nr:hypothetical protein FSARC_1183 [Fusarium sarcochroum]
MSIASTSDYHGFKEFNILTPNAMLGYGYSSDHFWYGVTRYRPTAIIVDSGSTDGGPYKLGMGKMTCGRGSYVRDLEPILAAAFRYKIKVLIGSVGGDGSNKHVAEMLEIVTEIAHREGYSFKVAIIEAEVDKDFIKSRISGSRVSPCGPVEPLLPEVVDTAVDVVAQMGAEPYLKALAEDPDIILGGRSYDPAPFAAFSILHGVLPGAAWHMGKIMECGGICAVPKGRSMIATLRKDSFDLTPLSPAERCTPLSVAAHTLYEKTRPDRLPGPGGVLNLDNAKYEQIAEKTCRVSQAQFIETPYQIKLEGVTHLGFRTIFIGGIRDPTLIDQVDDFLERVRQYSHNLFPELDKSEQCQLKDAVVEFKSERLYTLAGKPMPSSWGSIGGLHKTSDGFVRIHDSFPNHAEGTLQLLDLAAGSSREQVSEKIADWASIDLENCATAEGKLAIYALRSYRQWDRLPQSKAISNFPIGIKHFSASPSTGLSARMEGGNSKCLEGLRVVELSRVIAAPLCGMTLAAHGAEVIWVTSPNLPDLPSIDRNFARGKRTVQLDIHNPDDKSQLLQLLKDCDVFIQGFRPGSLASYGLSQEELIKINPNIIVANMSAFGPDGPWSGRRGFDSLVQTCSGMNVSEAEHAAKGEAARPTPCQALDHAGGYMLAAGVMAALYRRATNGGSWRVDMSLAGIMKYLRSLGQYPGASGFEAPDFNKPEDVPETCFEIRETGFGSMTAIKHCATIEGLQVGWDVMPKPLGSDKAEWT